LGALETAPSLAGRRVASGAPARIGVISDTHGLLRAEAVSFLAGCNHIIHAGDVGSHSILETLSKMAPLVAVRGNNDTESWASGLHETEVLNVAGHRIFVLHDVSTLDVEPRQAGIHVVISGHSHKPSMAERNGVLYLNPGSAGPRRFKLPISVAEILIAGGAMTPRLIDLSA
jgi:putative phosphoesterase